MAKQENTQSKKSSLIVDHCGKETGKIWLESQGKLSLLQKNQSTDYKNENILTEITTTMSKNQLSWENIAKIYVCAGPGSFMSTRVIAVIFNFICEIKKIPLWQFQHNETYQQAHSVKKISPIYER